MIGFCSNAKLLGRPRDVPLDEQDLQRHRDSIGVLADVPPEVEWFANISNRHTRRACESAVKNPVTHGRSQRNLAAAGPDGVCSKVEQDHPGAGAVSDPKKLDLATVFKSAKFYELPKPERVPASVSLLQSSACRKSKFARCA
jgi:hypothetical protein